MVLYISGPITGIDHWEDQFIDAKKRIESHGHTVVSPLSVDVLHLNNYSWSDCMKICISLMEKCDGIVMLNGWTRSVGCAIEHGWAKQIGLDVYEHGPARYADVDLS